MFCTLYALNMHINLKFSNVNNMGGATFIPLPPLTVFYSPNFDIFHIAFWSISLRI